MILPIMAEIPYPYVPTWAVAKRSDLRSAAQAGSIAEKAKTAANAIANNEKV
jgi:hypothetical protein